MVNLALDRANQSSIMLILTLKLQPTSNLFLFIHFCAKLVLIFHVSRLPADNSHEISSLKSSRNELKMLRNNVC